MIHLGHLKTIAHKNASLNIVVPLTYDRYVAGQACTWAQVHYPDVKK